MEAIEVIGTPRTGTGKGECRRMRATGAVPAVVYGHGIAESIAVSVDARSLTRALDNPKGQNALFSFQLEGGPNHTVLVRELQRDPVTRRILHVDFVAPNLEQPLVSNVPVRLTGRSVGVSIGGRLRKPYREVKLTAVPAKIPAEVVLDITEMNVGDAVMASDLPLPEGVAAVFDTDYVVVKVVAPRGRQAEAAEAGTEEAEG
ncbi:MAG: 50S ribosomal protein L25 [Myxococcota bacterium]|nr:50S ribosomal protein L25 [Myxococcota bacterium]